MKCPCVCHARCFLSELSILSSTMALSLDEEVRLWSSNAERDQYTSLSNLFGIVVSLDYLERAYVRDAITAAE